MIMKKCSKCESYKEFEFFTKNKENLLEYKKEYYKDNKDNYLERSKYQRENNPEYLSQYLKNWREENKDYSKKYIKNWWLLNPDKRREYWVNMRINKPHYIAWRSSLRLALDRMGKEKNGHTIDLLGYTPSDLCNHMEYLFMDGMSWDNWGEWHIDHIHSISKFNKNTPMCIVNSLDNLQPLWASDNLSKSNKI